MTTPTSTFVDRRIVAISERWVFLGDYHEAKGVHPAYLTDASCIRNWGTTAGLGQIAFAGPTASTKLDPCGTVVLQPNAVLFSLKCVY